MNRLSEVACKVYNGERISKEDALILYNDASLTLLALLAEEIKRRFHKDNIVTFIVDRNINYTNICISACKFCAFYRKPEDPSGYVLTHDELERKIFETKRLGGGLILLQGGLHPNLPLSYHLETIRLIKKHGLHCHGYSAPEIIHFSRIYDLRVEEVLEKLIEAGLDSIPGGGAEILSDRVRKIISPNKATTHEWLKVMEIAHTMGLRTTATMMFGHIETIEERIEHLRLIRDLQDRTMGFTAFIPWSFQPRNTQLNVCKASSVEYLKMLAISRIFLDNVRNIQVSYVTQGKEIAQVGLFFGANDFGSAMIEENVVAATGVNNLMPITEIEMAIRECGFVPKRRRMDYSIID